MRLLADQKMHGYKAMSWGGYNGDAMEATFARLPKAKEANFLATFVAGKDGEPAVGKILRSSAKEIAFKVKTGKKTYTIRIDLEAKKTVVSAR